MSRITVIGNGEETSVNVRDTERLGGTVILLPPMIILLHHRQDHLLGGRLTLVLSRVLETLLGKRASDSYDTLDPWQDWGTRTNP